MLPAGYCPAMQARGRNLALIDRHGAAGLETSFGNAGLIERGSILPHLCPRDLAKQMRYALNLSPEAHYHLSALPQLAPWLWRYCRASAPERAAKTAAAVRPLIERCLAEHEAFDFVGAGELLRKTGWIELYRSSESMPAGLADVARLRACGLRIDTLDAAAL